MMDAPTIQAVEASIYAAGYPTDAAAILLIELDGAAAGLGEDAARVTSFCTDAGARAVRAATDPADRAASGRGARRRSAPWDALAPHLVVQDAVVPRTRLPQVLAEIGQHRPATRRAGVQRLPRRRRQPASQPPVRRERSRTVGARPRRDEGDHGSVHRRRWHHHRRARDRVGQASVHGSPVLRRDAGRDVRAAQRLRSGPAVESGQGRAGPQLSRVARCTVGTPTIPRDDRP